MRVIKNYFWRQRTKLEATFAFSMMEPWEKLLCMVIFTFFTLLLISGLYQYLPEHISTMQRRASYYLWGQDGDDWLVKQWVESPSPVKEL
ncbi:hypothetical protein EDC04DRAFT_2581609 [Pisolithus marmoratus]|nr:hypothetical protein EDC04DRAFT_2581609 [Pisolithus marmoratus]